jgi:putative effector of murein hydrolase LrgA (UPF0299 family)
LYRGGSGPGPGGTTGSSGLLLFVKMIGKTIAKTMTIVIAAAIISHLIFFLRLASGYSS